MNSSIAGAQSVGITKNRDATTAVPTERDRRIDITGLPATRVTEYLGSRDDDEVYFECRAGKTYVVATSEGR